MFDRESQPPASIKKRRYPRECTGIFLNVVKGERRHDKVEPLTPKVQLFNAGAAVLDRRILGEGYRSLQHAAGWVDTDNEACSFTTRFSGEISEATAQVQDPHSR